MHQRAVTTAIKRARIVALLPSTQIDYEENRSLARFYFNKCFVVYYSIYAVTPPAALKGAQHGKQTYA